jgi:hypothetical protein
MGIRMALKRTISRSGARTSRIEALESRQLFSATLVEITIPTTPTAPVKHVKHAVKHDVLHKSNGNNVSASGGQHANIGYEAFAG